MTILGVVTILWMVPLKEDNSSRDDDCPGMVIVLEMEIIKGNATVLGAHPRDGGGGCPRDGAGPKNGECSSDGEDGHLDTVV